MPAKKQIKWTAAQIKDQAEKIKKIVEKHKKENKEENFTAITPEEIDEKFKRVNSPMIVSQGWGGTTPGGSFNYSVGIYNPDPTTASSLYVHVFVGSGNVDPNTGTFLLNVDDRFPRLAGPPAFGQTLAPGASATLNFTIAVPATVQKTVYLGNSCLMQVSYHDTGLYLDRGCFPFTVS